MKAPTTAEMTIEIMMAPMSAPTYTAAELGQFDYAHRHRLRHSRQPYRPSIGSS
jgi:hypothetical protein